MNTIPNEPSLRLDPRRRGYLLDGTLHKGFPDHSELSDRQRTLIARWAERFAPQALSDAQRELLAAAPAPAASKRQRELAENQRELLSPYLSILFDSLREDEQRAIQNPVAAGAAAGYPLTVGQLAKLCNASERQIRRWADEGLLPFHRQGRDRRFYSAAAIRAFALVRAPGYSKAMAAAAARGEIGEHFQLLAATIARAANRMPADLCERLIALADDLSSSSRLMADIGDASELKALWHGADLHPAVAGPSAVIAEARRAEPGEDVVPDRTAKKAVVIEYKLAEGSEGRAPLEISEADEILRAKYGASQVVSKKVMVVTAPRGKGEWVNLISGHKQVLSVHTTKVEAEARGRAVARKRQAKHVIYRRDGLIARAREYS